jgi:glutathione S-transferase
MTDLILHHYAGSPFSEKVRLVLGYKGLAWKSVTVPMILPKPDVVCLTGGYRRTPFLQIGADIWCDTALMCRVIDRLHPSPPLYPASAGGLQEVIAQWADTALFWTAVPYALQPAGAQHLFAGAPPEVMKAFVADRTAMRGTMRLPSITDARAQLVTYLGWLARELEDGRAFLRGGAPCIADFSAAQSVWYIRRVPPVAQVLAPFPDVVAWFDRIAAFGHGTHEPMTSADAIGIARAAASSELLAFDEGQGYVRGADVTVTPTDYAMDPVAGRLVGLTDDEAAIERDDERAGRVVVHFPRIGYQVKKA